MRNVMMLKVPYRGWLLWSVTLCVAVACFLTHLPTVRAQQSSAPKVIISAQASSFPKLIKFVVPFSPGGSNDVYARALAQKLAIKLSNTIVVENKPGAGGSIGSVWPPSAPPARAPTAIPCRSSRPDTRT